MQPQRRTVVLVALVPFIVFAGATGCRTSSAIHPGELRRLDGYHAARPAAPTPALQTLSGDRVAFTPGSNLYLGLPEADVGGRFESIRVRDGIFQGQTTAGAKIEAPVEGIRQARVENVSPTRTGGVIAGTLTAVLLVSAPFIFAYAVIQTNEPQQ